MTTEEGGTVAAPTIEVPAELLPFITEFTFAIDDTYVRITRRDNHGHLLEGGWAVQRGEWYLNRGAWEYKNGVLWDSPAMALSALRAATHPDRKDKP